MSQIDSYAAKLYERRDEAAMTGHAQVSLGDWQPVLNDCHQNVATWCANVEGFIPVRGWLYFDFVNMLPYVRFTAHSVVQTPSGELVDITPSQASAAYPFIRALESEEEYAALVQQGICHIDHYR